MARDIIFERLTVSSLDRIVKYLDWNPSVSDSSTTLLSDFSDEERIAWLDRNRAKIEDQISRVGTPSLRNPFGAGKSYHQIVRDLATQLGVEGSEADSTEQLEQKTANKIWMDVLDHLNPEEKQEFISKVKDSASRQAPSINNKQFAAFADLSSEYQSDLGGPAKLPPLTYLLGGLLGTAIFAIQEMDGRNYKKLLPVVIRIAAERTVEKPPHGTVSQEEVNREVENWPPFAGLCPSSKDAFETALQHLLGAAANQSRRDSDLRTAAFYFSKAVECQLRKRVFEPFRVQVLNSQPRDPLINQRGESDGFLGAFVDGEGKGITLGQMVNSMKFVRTLFLYVQNQFPRLLSLAILEKLEHLVKLRNREGHEYLDPQLAAQARELAESVIEAMN